MKVRQRDKRPLVRPITYPILRWFWCAMLFGAIGVAMMMDRLPLLPT